MLAFPCATFSRGVLPEASSATRRTSHITFASKDANSNSTAASLRKNPSLYSNADTAVEAPVAEAPTRKSYLSFDPVPPKQKPEVLAPAGGWPQLYAAVENGADAVYFGVGDLNARARASNFLPEELPQVMEYLHARGVKGYQVLNVLIFDDELETLAQRAQEAAAAGVDAVIVQDVGAVEIINRAAPGLAVHGSTQMTITSAEGAAFAASRGIERIVVGRELSVKDIASVSSTPSAPEVEAFVHGALCVSYSGQCFSSEAWGGRSANRGQCAQACRLDYGLQVDGELKYMGDVQYLLSPQDLSAINIVPQLIAAGVVSFKIEGRLKGPEYVAMTTRVYREAVDAAWAAYQQNESALGTFQYTLDDSASRELRQVFARGQDGAFQGLTSGFLEGPQHQKLVRGRAPRHRGVFLGQVDRVTRGGSGGRENGAAAVVVKLAAPARRGDGIVFDHGEPQTEEFGGAIYDIKVVSGKNQDSQQQSGRRKHSNCRVSSSAAAVGPGGKSVLEADEGAYVELRLGPGSGSDLLTRVKPGDLIWKNKDPVLESKLRASYEAVSAAERRRIPVKIEVIADVGAPMQLVLTDIQGRRAAAETESLVEAASGRPLTSKDIEKAIGVHLGDEGALVAAEFDYSKCDLSSGSGLFVPAMAIKNARRKAVAGLLEQQLAVPAFNAQDTIVLPHPDDVLASMRQEIAEESKNWSRKEENSGEERETAASMLRVLCRTKAQVDAAVQIPWLNEIVLDFLEVHGLKEACEAVKQSGKRVIVASPRILKPDERRLWLFYLRLGADALLVRGAGLMHQLMEAGGPGAIVPGAEEHPIPALEGDFSLNAANVVSADLLLKSGLSRLAPTHDCNADQLAGLARGLGARGHCLEAILHQNLPIFHTEHCVFARFLSTGNSFLDCGHPCEHHTVHLRSPEGTDHLVLADMGCRNTVFDGTAQSGLPFIDKLVAAGFGCFRVELVDQPAHVVKPLMEGYKTAIEDALEKAHLGSSSVVRKKGFSEVESSRRELWDWMNNHLTDANGRAHGVGVGSLEPRAERAPESMKQTAAAKRAAVSGKAKTKTGK